MVSTTRSRRFALCRILRSWRNWKPFVAPPVTVGRHTAQKPDKMYQLCRIKKNASTEVAIRLPLEILEKIFSIPTRIPSCTSADGCAKPGTSVYMPLQRHSADAWLSATATVGKCSGQPIEGYHSYLHLWRLLCGKRREIRILVYATW